ncbi:MAG: sensor histidine kinase [Rubrobacter sp.]|nr:sensor histidine kinase [Rubrobacter sp.]
MSERVTGRERTRGIRWVLPLGVGVAVLTYPLAFLAIDSYATVLSLLGRGAPEPGEVARFGEAVYLYLWPGAHFLLAALAASFAARRAGGGALRHGLAVGLVSVLASQAISLYYGPLLLEEFARFLVLGAAGGLLGGAVARRALAAQEALYRASRETGAARDAREIAAAVGVHLSGPGVTGVALWEAASGSEEGDFSFLGAWTPPASGEWPVRDRLEAGRLPALGELRTRGATVARVGSLPSPERAAWRRAGARSLLLLPLTAPGVRLSGLLVVASRRPGFAPGVVRRYQTAGAQAALALENLRLVEEARRAGRQAGVLKERQRLSHEIHDTLAQGFTSIVMNLEAAEGSLTPEAGDLRRARRHLDGARRTARESLTEARRLVRDLRPEPLEGAPLTEVLGGVVERWSQESGVRASATVTGTQRQLTPEAEVTLLRVAQEALANTRRHARAERAALTLSFMPGRIVLDVRDDGAGFDPAAGADPGAPGGFGLRGMRERVEAAGGTLSVESTPGEGTSLVAELPVPAEDPSGATGSATVAEGVEQELPVASRETG